MPSDTTPTTTTLAAVYKRWDNYQRLLVEAIAPLTPEHLALQADPNVRPAWTLAAALPRAMPARRAAAAITRIWVATTRW